ncbi:L-rhamnose-binding lectin CSL3-like [Pangasianodon hypophthalmus]|uniref:L-rhamnose-binding lectin CSL3-like n=1 Tax=Pangasianodon hypophthalmus TaxID=310915 RepID=UPI0023079224|nr:L-rhamnose-binding lectin CSL3-like [Pangasianodon hypophthalmus]
MMLLKLTLLTLLIAAPGMHVSGENLPCTADGENSMCPISVTCEGGTAVLNCGNRRIRIIRAFYGRIDSTTCAAGRPRKQICNRHCSARGALHQVAARCNGRCYCQVPATNYVFSDPCYGTYKYLRIAYYCCYLIT